LERAYFIAQTTLVNSFNLFAQDQTVFPFYVRRNFVFENLAGNTCYNYGGGESVADIILDNQNRAMPRLFASYIIAAQFSKVNVPSFDIHSAYPLSVYEAQGQMGTAVICPQITPSICPAFALNFILKTQE